MHIKHTGGSFEYVPYFCLPANELTEVIAPSCYSCFDYTNGLADLVRALWPRSLRLISLPPSGSLLFCSHVPAALLALAGHVGAQASPHGFAHSCCDCIT